MLKLLLAVFVTLKVLIPKQKLFLKIACIPVAIAGITQIILVISYLRIILSYISSTTQINLLLTNLQLADLIFKIILSLFVIFISIHTFRPFLKNSISLLITSFIIFAIFTLNVAINILLKGPILMPTISYIITYASLFSVCYYALRREDLEYNVNKTHPGNYYKKI